MFKCNILSHEYNFRQIINSKVFGILQVLTMDDRAFSIICRRKKYNPRRFRAPLNQRQHVRGRKRNLQIRRGRKNNIHQPQSILEPNLKRRKLSHNRQNIEISNSSYPIFIRTIIGRDNRTLTFVVKDTWKINHIVILVSNKINVATNNISLFYGNKKLSEDKSLEFYQITRDSTLNAAIRPQPRSPSTLLQKIKPIQQNIENLRNSYKIQISSVDSITDLNETMQEIKGSFNEKLQKLKAQKLKIYTEINKICDDKYQKMMETQQSATNEIIDLDAKIDDLDEKINKLQTEKNNYVQKRKYQQKILREAEATGDIKKKCDESRTKIDEITESMDEDMSHMLSEFVSDKLKQFESKYKEWNEEKFLSWLKSIENGKFGDEEYSEHIGKIKQLDINGNRMKELTVSCLTLIGLNRGDRKILSQHIKRVIIENSILMNNLCSICVKNPINTAFLPCRHQAVCFECYEESPMEFEDCPICRKKVEETIQTFMTGFTQD